MRCRPTSASVILAGFAILLASAGCDTAQRTVGNTIVPETDSVRWADPSRPVPYAMTWEPEPGLKTMNLWNRSVAYWTCGGVPAKAGLGRYSVVFRGDLPALWAFGDTIHGSAVTASLDSLLALHGGSLWAVRSGDTLRGEAVSRIGTPCGDTLDTLRFTLYRQN